MEEPADTDNESQGDDTPAREFRMLSDEELQEIRRRRDALDAWIRAHRDEEGAYWAAYRAALRGRPADARSGCDIGARWAAIVLLEAFLKVGGDANVALVGVGEALEWIDVLHSHFQSGRGGLDSFEPSGTLIAPSVAVFSTLFAGDFHSIQATSLGPWSDDFPGGPPLPLNAENRSGMIRPYSYSRHSFRAVPPWRRV